MSERKTKNEEDSVNRSKSAGERQIREETCEEMKCESNRASFASEIKISFIGLGQTPTLCALLSPPPLLSVPFSWPLLRFSLSLSLFRPASPSYWCEQSEREIAWCRAVISFCSHPPTLQFSEGASRARSTPEPWCRQVTPLPSTDGRGNKPLRHCWGVEPWTSWDQDRFWRADPSLWRSHRVTLTSHWTVSY